MDPLIFGATKKNEFYISRFHIKYISHVKLLQYFLRTVTSEIRTGRVPKFILALGPEIP